MDLFAPKIYIPYSAQYIYHQRSIKTASIITPEYEVQSAECYLNAFLSCSD